MASFGNNDMSVGMGRPQSIQPQQQPPPQQQSQQQQQQQQQYYNTQQGQYYQRQEAASDPHSAMQISMPPPSTPAMPSRFADQHIQQHQRQQPQIPFTLSNSYAPSNTGAGNNIDIGNNMTPMPDVGMYNALLNNSMVGGLNGKNGLVGAGSAGGGDKNRQAVDLAEFAVEPKVALNKLITKEMKEHWALVEKLNLLDTDRLDQMYTYHDALLEDKKFLYTYLCSEYRQKYHELYETYESLEAYVTYVALVLIYGSENQLKKACDGNTSSVYSPRVGESTFKLRVFNRKRKTAATAVSSAVTGTPSAEIDSDEARVKRARPSEGTGQEDKAAAAAASAIVTAENTPVKVTENHPFFKERLFTSHMTLFKLGDMVKYCIPSEFAIMFCGANTSTVYVYGQGDVKMPCKGVRVTFSKPVVSLIRSRSYKSYTYQSLELFGLMKDFMAKITGRTTDQEAFRLSSLKDMTMEDLITQRPVKPINWDCEAGFNLAIVTNFSCTDTNAGVLCNRAYSTPIYHIPKSFVDISDADVEDMNNKASNHKTYERRSDLLNDYYDRLEGLADDERTA